MAILPNLSRHEESFPGFRPHPGYNLLHMLRRFYVKGEEIRRSIEWLIRRLIKVGARISYHAKKWNV